MTNTTIYRFGPCELDEARRALTAHGQEIRLQPRVLDLLCYLVRHRDRVVPKDELLEALWPRTIVVDNALQRVVSLARSALADAGLPGAVRTYSRHGYRFCFDDGVQSLAPATGQAGDAAARARSAFDGNDWAAACEAYATAHEQGLLAPPDIEQWGRAAICAGLGPGATGALERLVAHCDAAGDTLGAARAALLLVQIRTDLRESVNARGLLQRVSRYLDDHAAVPERGHYAWMASRLALGGGDFQEALARADEACALGRALRDPDVECLGLVYRGHALSAAGDAAAGLVHHEEAAAVIRLGHVQSWAAGWALCSILYAARYRSDWVRAGQFADAFTDWSRSCAMPAFPGTCQLHRAAVLGVRGELDRAATEVRSAAALLARVAPWAEGDAYCVLGDIQLHDGNLEQAGVSYRQAHALGWEPQPGLARLHLLTGRADLALRGLERALDSADWTLREKRGELLCMLALAAVAAGDPERARQTLHMLDAAPVYLATEAIKALYCGAWAEIALHDGDAKLASRHLREAVRHWREVGSPLSESQARLRLAESMLREGDTGGAELELHAIDANAVPLPPRHHERLQALRAALEPTRQQ